MIRNGVDVAAIDEARSRWCIPGHPHRVRRPLSLRKGCRHPHRRVSKACGNVSEVDLLIAAGTGREEEARLQQKAAAAGAGRIPFPGPSRDDEACCSLLEGALFAVLPSRTEGYPIMAVESLAGFAERHAARRSRIPSIEAAGGTGPHWHACSSKGTPVNSLD